MEAAFFNNSQRQQFSGMSLLILTDQFSSSLESVGIQSFFDYV